MKKRVILAGNAVPEDWDFQKGVEEETGKSWEVKRCCINEYVGLKKYTRYLKYIVYPFYLIAVRSQYEVIISWEQFFGLMMAFYLRFFRVRSCPPIDIMTFIYRPKKGWIGKAYYYFVKSAVTSRYIRRIYVFSSSEIAHYAGVFGIEKEKFVAETLGIADRAAIIHEQPPIRTDAFFLAAGRSNRDYDFLRRAWEGRKESLCIVCDVEMAEDTPNIRYEKNCHGDGYLRLLADARAVIVPLRSREFSSGQLVVLQAAMLGKPVIVTENDTIQEYIENGKTGFIIPKDSEALWNSIGWLEDDAHYERISQNARHEFEERFSLYELGCRIGRRQEIDLENA